MSLLVRRSQQINVCLGDALNCSRQLHFLKMTKSWGLRHQWDWFYFSQKGVLRMSQIVIGCWVWKITLDYPTVSSIDILVF